MCYDKSVKSILGIYRCRISYLGPSDFVSNTIVCPYQKKFKALSWILVQNEF